MTMLQHSVIESGGYNIDRSLRFRSSASANLTRTPSTTSNRKTWTWSGWVKRGALGVYSPLFIAGTTNGQQVGSLAFSSAGGVYDKLELNFGVQGTSTEFWLQTTQVFRDPSAWYHIVVAVDTTQATASNRVKFYVNGSQITALGAYASYNQYPSQNYDTSVNNTVQHLTSRDAVNTAGYFDGYLAEVNFIDGQALTPSSFGETSTETGVWVPKKYTGTYGTNGFYLPFSDNTSATTLAYDKSGNGNNWTANNISTTSGATYDSMTDVPTLTSATAANTATINPIYNNSQSYVSYANLRVSPNDNNWRANLSTIGVSSGKWYVEGTLTNQSTAGFCFFGIASAATILANDNYLGATSTSYSYRSNGETRNSGSVVNASYGATYTTGDVIGIALDMDAGTLAFYKNGTSQGTAFSSLSGTYLIGTSPAGSGTIVDMNFGQRPFSHTPPTGFKALNTFNLPDPTIKKPNQYMDATTYTGNGGTLAVTNAGGFQPDLVWIKCRSAAYYNTLYDSVRGAGTSTSLYSNSTDAEGAYGVLTNMSAFNSNGFTVSTTSSSPNTLNENGSTFVGWQWKESATAGFDIVTYTGDGTNRNISHNLGVAPSMIIVKSRNATNGWYVCHVGSWGGDGNGLFLNNTASTYNRVTDLGGTGITAMTSSYFTATTGSGAFLNTSGTTYVAYVFAAIPGMSAFGSYTGNGSTDGPFVYCGFKPKYLLRRRTDSAAGWDVVDTSRNPYNSANAELQPNDTGGDNVSTSIDTDLLSNGFKMRNTANGNLNASGGTYIYAAFAENPFKYSNAR